MPIIMELLGELPGGTTSRSEAVSADGTTVVGNSGSTAGTRAFRWTKAGGMVNLGSISGGDSYAYDVSGDGAIVVGLSYDNGYVPLAWRWTQASGTVSLGPTGNATPRSYASGISKDGITIVGVANIVGADNDRAFRWTQATGIVTLGVLPAHSEHSYPGGVSADGSVVVGYSQALGNTQRAFRWTQAEGMVDLGIYIVAGLTVSQARALDVSEDGNTVLCSMYYSNGTWRYTLWTAATGHVLAFANINNLNIAIGMSGNGLYIVGERYNVNGYEAIRWALASGFVDYGRGIYTRSYATDADTNGVILCGAVTSPGIAHAARWITPPPPPFWTAPINCAIS